MYLFLLENLGECIEFFKPLMKEGNYKTRSWYSQYINLSQNDLVNLLKARNDVLKSEGKDGLDKMIAEYRFKFYGKQ
mgnify:CR=1 FL=1